MPKRPAIPKATSEAVLKEYRHLCAVCAKPAPQLHHLDEDPSNNDPLNLLPLCPNCHLQDAHDPTSPPNPRKLRLFRIHKDPLILDPRFHPFFLRLLPVRDKERRKNQPKIYGHQVNELMKFIGEFQMGEFYRKKVLALLNNPTSEYKLKLILDGDKTAASLDKQSIWDDALSWSFDQIDGFVVELIRYQGWNNHPL